ncbi:MAG: hypothetical protein C4308_02995 [Chitinophagaceae bacterium]
MRESNSNIQRKEKAIRKFLYYFPKGFKGQKYVSWERDYQWQAQVAWLEGLNKKRISRVDGRK